MLFGGTLSLIKEMLYFFKYANPIQPGIDSFTFSTTPPMEFGVTKGDVNLDDEVNIADIITFINHLLHAFELETDDQLYVSRC